MFDKLIKRETFKPCPRGANALLVYVALLATHEFFRSDTGRGEDGDGMHREWVNAHSSFLDLQSLYGSSPEEAKGARSFKDGKLKLDCVGERRLLRLPVMRAILKLFALEHNYIAEQLTEHHGGEFSDEEGLFQAARAVMLAQFIQIITYDYVGGINGPEALHSMERFLQNSRPFKKEGDIAMHVSVEFKLMYQFHATIPEKFSEDGDWLGLDDNDDVEAVLGAALKIPSGAFGSRNTPAFLRRAEIASVNFGRRTGMCSYNDMRKHLGLEPAESFESICSDPDVVCRLREFYPGGIEDLELYIGCTVEENRSWPQGWSLGPTLFTALVQDARASGMGDFFHTVGFEPEYQTKW
jgi:prostaglandin-endoperoxide synthase 2